MQALDRVLLGVDDVYELFQDECAVLLVGEGVAQGADRIAEGFQGGLDDVGLALLDAEDYA